MVPLDLSNRLKEKLKSINDSEDEKELGDLIMAKTKSRKKKPKRELREQQRLKLFDEETIEKSCTLFVSDEFLEPRILPFL